MFGVPPVEVDHANIVEPQFGDMVGCRVEQYNEQNNEQNNQQYNEQYNEQNNEQDNQQYNEQYNHPNHDVEYETNNEQVDDFQNLDEEAEPEEIQRRGRRVQKVSCTATDMLGTSEVRCNVTQSDSDNATTWVIPGADSYSFGVGTSSNLAAQEPRTMIYKGQFFLSKKDLKRLVGHFAMRQNFEWKVKRSNKTTLHLVCIIDDCTWKVRAVRRAEGTYFQVRSFVNKHTCPLEEVHRRHRQASAAIIGEVVAPRLQQSDGCLMRPKDII